MNITKKWETPNISDIRRALYFMIDAHDGVYRKFSGKEYAHHPVEVAKIVRNYKKSIHQDKLIISALLHDTVEDVEEITIDLIRELFGNMVASIVDELTSDLDGIKKKGKSKYLLDKMLNMSSYSLVIKLSDRLHNCSDLDKGSDKFRSKYVKETRFILNGLEERYLSETHRLIMDAIDSKISKFE